MIRDRYGETWAGRADLAKDWGQEAADAVWDDMLDTCHTTRTLVEEGGVPRLDPDGVEVGWDDLIPMSQWVLLVPDCREIAKDVFLGDGMSRKLEEMERKKENGYI